jgi:SSS family solute:Na+ symporter
MNARGALAALLVGFSMGLFRMLVDTPVTLGLAGFENGYTPGSFLWICNNIYFQYFSVLITFVSAGVMVGVSLMSPPPDEASIRSLTFETQTDEDRARTRAGWDGRDVAASVVVLLSILAAYLYFRG